MSRVNEIFPQLFSWCEIPEGTTKFDQEIFTVEAFKMAKYPITNSQFSRFLLTGGYMNPSWWIESGWAWKQKRKWEHPRYWNDINFNEAEQPIVGVSWHEASAFCRWLSYITGESIRLPTEQQWQRSAQGSDERPYPWGEVFGLERCNSKESGLGKTSSVTAQPKGESPFGLSNMSGNIWEWTSTDYFSGNYSPIVSYAVMRGGSFLDAASSNRLKVTYRTSAYPHISSRNLGFRIART